mmetsp:Transcript_4209/g.15417  ORF Transcript_4209/g.15417 Transcript_4209/m.15417 type:complete len:221 (+) Transcript_4209:1018-1680(+)
MPIRVLRRTRTRRNPCSRRCEAPISKQPSLMTLNITSWCLQSRAMCAMTSSKHYQRASKLSVVLSLFTKSSSAVATRMPTRCSPTHPWACLPTLARAWTSPPFRNPMKARHAMSNCSNHRRRRKPAVTPPRASPRSSCRTSWIYPWKSTLKLWIARSSVENRTSRKFCSSWMKVTRRRTTQFAYCRRRTRISYSPSPRAKMNSWWRNFKLKSVPSLSSFP